MKIQVLNHGYVELIELWGMGRDGCDDRVEHEVDHSYIQQDRDYEVGIIEAARQSTQGAFRGWDPAACTCGYAELLAKQTLTETEFDTMALTYKGKHKETCEHRVNPGDAKLLRHLFTNHHDTPFEFAGMVIEVQAPLFVFREWHRHRTQSYNEMSARYAPLPDIYYTPERNNVLQRGVQNTANKQASGVTELNPFHIDAFLANVDKVYAKAESVYQTALTNGIPKELARVVMPVGHYSRMRAAANLRNWLSFMTLRCDLLAQWETQQFAWAVANIVAEKFPRTYQLWDEQHNQ